VFNLCSYMNRCMKSDPASRVQMMGIHPIVFSSVESKKSGLGRSCHETAQLTSHSSSEGFSKETFLANAQLAGCNWNSPRYFCTQITKNTRDHPLSGSIIKQHNTFLASFTTLVRIFGKKLAHRC